MSNVDFEQSTPSGSGNDNNDNNNNNNPNCSRLASIRNYKLANWFPQVSFVYPLISHSPYPIIHSVFPRSSLFARQFSHRTCRWFSFMANQIKMFTLWHQIHNDIEVIHLHKVKETESIVVAGCGGKYPGMA